MGATSPERHREVAVTPFQSDLTGATRLSRSRLHHPERRDRSDTAWSLANPRVALGATSRSDHVRSLGLLSLGAT
ncbi:hypothetical protein YC2023_010657 [Brassica napus]